MRSTGSRTARPQSPASQRGSTGYGRTRSCACPRGGRRRARASPKRASRSAPRSGGPVGIGSTPRSTAPGVRQVLHPRPVQKSRIMPPASAPSRSSIRSPTESPYVTNISGPEHGVREPLPHLEDPADGEPERERDEHHRDAVVQPGVLGEVRDHAQVAQRDVEQHRRAARQHEVHDLVVAVDVVEEREHVAPDGEVHAELEDEVERPLDVEHARREHEQERAEELGGVGGLAHQHGHDRADERDSAQQVQRVAHDAAPVAHQPHRQPGGQRPRADHQPPPEGRRPPGPRHDARRRRAPR